MRKYRAVATTSCRSSCQVPMMSITCRQGREARTGRLPCGVVLKAITGCSSIRRPSLTYRFTSLDGLTSDRSACLTSSRSAEHTSELQSRFDLVCRLLLEKKKAALTPLKELPSHAQYSQCIR